MLKQRTSGGQRKLAGLLGQREEKKIDKGERWWEENEANFIASREVGDTEFHRGPAR